METTKTSRIVIDATFIQRGEKVDKKFMEDVKVRKKLASLFSDYDDVKISIKTKDFINDEQ